MNTPKISVIVPVYNVEKWLNRCVDSILAQTFTDFELLLIDDGSTDASGAICDEYAQRDTRIRVFHKPNGGVSSARNLGLDNAQGEWISFVDSDDFVDLCFLNSLCEKTHENCDIVSCGFHVYEDGVFSRDVIFQPVVRNNREYLNEILRYEMPGSLWNKLIRKAIIDTNRLRLDCRIEFREDEEFVFRFLTYCRVGIIISQPLYHYFMPNWSKYCSSNTRDKALYLYASLSNSIHKIGLKNTFANNLKKETFRVFCSSVFHNPLRVFHNSKIYLKSLHCFIKLKNA